MERGFGGGKWGLIKGLGGVGGLLVVVVVVAAAVDVVERTAEAAKRVAIFGIFFPDGG